MIDERRHPSNPWLTSRAVFLLDQLLKSDDIGVEFGSGRSTLWFAQRLKHITSIEDNKAWFSTVTTLLANAGVAQKVDYRLAEDEASYAGQASTFSDQSVDFCLVDGSARDSCALGMVPKVKSGGLLVVDNVNWYLPNDVSRSPNTLRSHQGTASKTWAEFSEQTKQWRRIWTSNGVTDTCIFFKP